MNRRVRAALFSAGLAFAGGVAITTSSVAHADEVPGELLPSTNRKFQLNLEINDDVKVEDAWLVFFDDGRPFNETCRANFGVHVGQVFHMKSDVCNAPSNSAVKIYLNVSYQSRNSTTPHAKTVITPLKPIQDLPEIDGLRHVCEEVYKKHSYRYASDRLYGVQRSCVGPVDEHIGPAFGEAMNNDPEGATRHLQDGHGITKPEDDQRTGRDEL